MKVAAVRVRHGSTIRYGRYRERNPVAAGAPEEPPRTAVTIAKGRHRRVKPATYRVQPFLTFVVVAASFVLGGALLWAGIGVLHEWLPVVPRIGYFQATWLFGAAFGLSVLFTIARMAAIPEAE
jgi:hypothetical protein